MKYIVDPSGGGTHLTIQAAIDDDSRRRVVYLHPGVYRESITVPTGIAFALPATSGMEG